MSTSSDPAVTSDVVAAGAFAASTAASPPPFRLSVERYHRMIAAGILTRDDKVELLEGCLVATSPIGAPHRFTVIELSGALKRVSPPGWDIFTQQPITLAASEPEPDIAVVRGANADYRDRHPGPEDVGLIAEVSDSSLAIDRGQKLRIYAAAGIPEYWVFNVADRCVEIHRRPQPASGGRPATYAQRQTFDQSSSWPVTLDGVQVGEMSLASLLP